MTRLVLSSGPDPLRPPQTSSGLHSDGYFCSVPERSGLVWGTGPGDWTGTLCLNLQRVPGRLLFLFFFFLTPAGFDGNSQLGSVSFNARANRFQPYTAINLSSGLTRERWATVCAHVRKTQFAN